MEKLTKIFVVSVLVACAPTAAPAPVEPCPRYVRAPEIIDPYGEPSAIEADRIEVAPTPEPATDAGVDEDPFARVF